MINFFSNMIYWGKRTRKFTFQYFKKNRHKRDYYFSIYFRSLKELGIIVTSKPFLDNNWEEMWARFYLVNQFFRALIGNNNSKFKEYFGKFIPIPIELLLDGVNSKFNAGTSDAIMTSMGKDKLGKSNIKPPNSKETPGNTQREGGDPPIKKLEGNLKYLCSITETAFGLMQSQMNASNPIGNRNPFVIEYYYLIDRT